VAVSDSGASGSWTARLSAALLLAHVAGSFVAIRFYQIDTIYRGAVGFSQALIALSLCLGTVLLIQEIRKSRYRIALWPAVLLCVVGGELALVLLGDVLLPDKPLP
jgi:hypothetical protein